ncbi:MAG TPA: hypothetical protein VF893_00325 [Candidatus Bathyarchaeia archaeon]
MRAGGVIIFMVVFFLVVLVTYFMFDLPPGREVAGFLGIRVGDSTETGIRTSALLVGFFNGVVYGATALLVYTLGISLPAMLSRDKDS